AKLSLGIAPFVAKRNTPMDGLPFAGIREVERRLAYLRNGLEGRVDLRATSARWAWVEYQLAQGGREEGLACYHASRAGGRFADYRRAFEAIPSERKRRAIVRPGERVSGVRRLPQV
ncbi:MAG: radical SAM protein, partial [Myxococcales bacterium]|nr:radical SAM protein [Myxococcales bacterium]